MHNLDTLETPHEVDLLVAFSDISGFHRAVHKRNPQQFFDLLSGYYGCSLVFTLLFSKLLREWFAPDTSSRMDSIGWTGRGLAG